MSRLTLYSIVLDIIRQATCTDLISKKNVNKTGVRTNSEYCSMYDTARDLVIELDKLLTGPPPQPLNSVGFSPVRLRLCSPTLRGRHQLVDLVLCARN